MHSLREHFLSKTTEKSSYIHSFNKKCSVHILCASLCEEVLQRTSQRHSHRCDELTKLRERKLSNMKHLNNTVKLYMPIKLSMGVCFKPVFNFLLLVNLCRFKNNSNNNNNKVLLTCLSCNVTASVIYKNP